MVSRTAVEYLYDDIYIYIEKESSSWTSAYICLYQSYITMSTMSNVYNSL